MKRFLAITLGAMLVLSSLTYGKGKIQNGIDSVKASQETSTTIKTETGSITKINREATTTEATTETTTSAHRAIAVGYKSGDFKLSFTPEMIQYLKEHQRDFMPEDTKAGMIQAYLDRYTGSAVCSKQLFKEALNHPFDEPKQWEIRAQYCLWKNQNLVLYMCNQELSNFSGLYPLVYQVKQ